eukprot:2702217-Rhodomonas_salina.3
MCFGTEIIATFFPNVPLLPPNALLVCTSAHLHQDLTRGCLHGHGNTDPGVWCCQDEGFPAEPIPVPKQMYLLSACCATPGTHVRHTATRWAATDTWQHQPRIEV